MIDITKEEKYDFFEKYWWVVVGVGVCMFVQSVVFISTAASHFNLAPGNSEQGAIFLFNYMNHSSDVAAKLLGLSSSIGNLAIVPIILGVFIKIARGEK